MKIRIVVDNNTLIDRYYVGEPAVCYYIEMNGKRILFDTGYSDVFLANAKAMDIDLRSLTHIVLSHGHNDHTGGLAYLLKSDLPPWVRLVAHPGCFEAKAVEHEPVGAPVSLGDIENRFQYIPAVRPWDLSEGGQDCVFLGQIPRKLEFEGRDEIGLRRCANGWQGDRLEEDSALVCRLKDGLFIVTGCSHSGVCNIVDYARNVCRESRIVGILGGFHLFDVDNRLDKTIEFMKKARVGTVYPCHCVSLKAKARMMERLLVEEVGGGTEICLEEITA